MRVAAVAWCTQIPGLQVYLFRRISEDLVKNHIEGPKGLRMILAPWTQAKLVTIVEDEIRFWNGSKIYLCHCKDEKDRFKYLGAEIHVLLIDELTTFTDVIYRFLRSRVRGVGLKLPENIKAKFPRILCSSNPGGIGHHWVKWAFIDGVQPMDVTEQPDEEGGMLRQYIPARLDDNPSMAEDDPKYRQRLRGLGSKELVKAMEDGDWNVVAGAFFHEWSTPVHVIPPMRPKPEWTVFRAFDWGSSRPFSVGWYFVPSESFQLDDGRWVPRGAVVKFHEWYGMQENSPNVGLKMPNPEIAQGIRDRDKVLGVKIAYAVADPAIFAEHGGPSIAEQMGNGMSWQPADNERKAGWTQMRTRLVGDGDMPLLLFTSDCVNTIRTLPSAQTDNVKLDDVDTDGEDHALDETRYACMSRPYAKPTTVPKAPKLLQTVSFDELLAAHPSREKRSRI